MLPEDVAARLRYEARRRGVSVAELVREAVERHVPPPQPGRRLSFFGVGKGGSPDASSRVDEIVGEAIEQELRRG